MQVDMVPLRAVFAEKDHSVLEAPIIVPLALQARIPESRAQENASLAKITPFRQLTELPLARNAIMDTKRTVRLVEQFACHAELELKNQVIQVPALHAALELQARRAKRFTALTAWADSSRTQVETQNVVFVLRTLTRHTVLLDNRIALRALQELSALETHTSALRK